MTTSVIRAGGTGVAGVQTTGGDDGALSLKVGPLDTTVEALSIASSGAVTVGGASQFNSTVTVGAPGGSWNGAANGRDLTVHGGSETTTGVGQISVQATDAFGVNLGGGISFGGEYSAGDNIDWATLWGRKENATDDNTAGYMQFNTRVNGGNMTERMRIDSSGGAAIGTTISSNARLTVDQGTRAYTIDLVGQDSSDVASIRFINNAYSASRAELTAVAAGGLITSVGGSEKMRIDSGGDVMIGTTAADTGARLTVKQAASNLRVVHFENTRNTSGDENLRLKLGANCDNTSSYPFVYTVGTADRLIIFGNGNVQNTNNSYGALSDIKLKENITAATPKLADLMQVKVCNFNLIGETTKQIGVIAQELETVFPGMISESPDRDSENNDLGTTTKSVKYSVFVPMIIKAMQEQQVIIESLKTRITALEG